MELIIPKESKEYPGYFNIPGFPYAVVDPDGKFLNTRTGNKITPGPLPAGYWKISIFSEEKKVINAYVHRLLALTFVGRPKRHLDKQYDELEVNHIDGNKSNNDRHNLEWLTPKENQQHAISNFLTKHINVNARNIVTNDIMRFENISDCAKFFKVSITRFRRHLNSTMAGKITKAWHVFKIDDNTPWPEVKPKHYTENQWDVMYGVWYCKDITTDAVYINNTLEGLCGALMLPYHSIQSHVSSNIRDKPYKNWLVWYDDNPTVDVVNNLPKRSTPSDIREPMKVKFVSTIDNSEMIFDSFTKAGKHFECDSKNIHYAIVKRNGKFRDYIVSKV